MSFRNRDNRQKRQAILNQHLIRVGAAQNISIHARRCQKRDPVLVATKIELVHCSPCHGAGDDVADKDAGLLAMRLEAIFRRNLRERRTIPTGSMLASGRDWHLEPVLAYLGSR